MMHKSFSIIICLTIIIGINSCTETNFSSKDYTRYVNTLVGTPWKGNGGTLPSVGTPFAMTNFVPCTEINSIGGTPYRYENEHLIGFMATHQPAVWMGDYGFLGFWPSVNKVNLKPEDRKWGYSHDNEIAKPQYYETTLKKDGAEMKAAFSTSKRCALFQFKGATEKTFNLAFEASRSHLFNHPGPPALKKSVAS